MEDVWKCSKTGLRHHSTCLTASDIHRVIRTKSSFLSRPILLHKEGPKLKQLFRDCDMDNDKCLKPDEAINAPNCKRDCKWMKVWIKTFCD